MTTFRRTVFGYILLTFVGMAVSVLVLAACSTDTIPEIEPAPTAAPTVSAAPAPTAVPSVKATSVPQRDIAPDFTLADGSGGSLSLDMLVDGRAAAVIVFYRGVF